MLWTEGHGYGGHRSHSTHFGHKKFYEVKEVLVAESEDGTVLCQGDHRYPFELKIPEGNTPPSFEGDYGKIEHVLQAKMSRSWHTSSKDKKDLKFVSRTFPPMEQSPQSGSVDQAVGTFAEGQVHMTATVNKGVCSPGETLQITAKIANKSSSKMKIKCKIDKNIVYRADDDAKIQEGHVCKTSGETIAPGFEGEVSLQVTVPADAPLSILNCQIINVELYLKVYLDISLDFDPEVVLPLIVAAPDAVVQHG